MGKERPITINLKTGTYHIPSLNYDHRCLFDILQRQHENFKHVNVEKEEDPKYVYRILHFRRDPDGRYILLSLNRINKEAIEEYTTPDSNDISTLEIKDHLEGFVWAYLDTSNNIVLDKNYKISPIRFVKVISKMIDDGLVFDKDCPYVPLSGKPHFEISYDRLTNDRFENFYMQIEKLVSVTATARVLSNPIWERTKASEELERIILDLNSNKTVHENKDEGVNKENPLVRGFVDLSTEGHFDVKMRAFDSSDEPLYYSSTPKDDDIHKYEKVEKDIDKFGKIAAKLIKKVTEMRSANTDNKVPEDPYGGRDKDDDHQDGP